MEKVVVFKKPKPVGFQLYEDRPLKAHEVHLRTLLRLVQAFIPFQVDRVLNFKPIISHIIPFHGAGEAFRILNQEPQNALQVVLNFTKM